MPIKGLKIGNETIYISTNGHTFQFINPITSKAYPETYLVDDIKKNAREFVLTHYKPNISKELVKIGVDERSTSSGRVSRKPKNPNSSSSVSDFLEKGKSKGIDLGGMMQGRGVKFSKGAKEALSMIGDNFGRRDEDDDYGQEGQLIIRERSEVTKPLVLDPNSAQNNIFGNSEAKSELIDNLENSVTYPLIFKTSGGILLYGTPGNGKTAVVRWAVSRMENTVFFAPNQGNLTSAYQGESQKNMLALFDAASESIGKPPPVEGESYKEWFRKELERREQDAKKDYQKRLNEFLIKEQKETPNVNDIIKKIRDLNPSYRRPEKIKWETAAKKLFEEMEKKRKAETPDTSLQKDKTKLVKNAVIFLDELDGIARSRDEKGPEKSGGDTGILTTLLEQMDGIKKRPGVIVVAATNKPWLLDEAILRRFGKRIFVGMPSKKMIEAIVRDSLEKYVFPTKNIDDETGATIEVYPEKFDPILKSDDPNRNESLTESAVRATSDDDELKFRQDTEYIKILYAKPISEEEKVEEEDDDLAMFTKPTKSETAKPAKESDYYADSDSVLKNYSAKFQKTPSIKADSEFTYKDDLKIGVRDPSLINNDYIRLISAILRGNGDNPDVKDSLNQMKAEDESQNEASVKRISELFDSDNRPKSGSDVVNIMNLVIKAAAKRAFKENLSKGRDHKRVISRPDLREKATQMSKSEKKNQLILYLVSDEWYSENKDLRDKLQRDYPDSYQEYSFVELNREESTRLINLDIRVMDFADAISKFPSTLNTDNFIDLNFYKNFNQPYSQ